MPRINKSIIKQTIRAILKGEDHRGITLELINKEFIQDAIEFFKQIVNAKLDNQSISMDWYKDTFLSEELDKKQIASNAGIAIKSIQNKRKSTTEKIVIEESNLHFDRLLEIVDELCDTDINLDLSITFNNVTVHLNLNESLIVINALSVRRAQNRGGAWSALGKNVEEPLLKTMCLLFNVPNEHFSTGNRENLREVDFYLKTNGFQDVKCETKLMGQGNPEGADATFARNTDVFIASTLSETNKKQLDQQGVQWVELNKTYGFLKFGEVLKAFSVPYEPIRYKVIHKSDTTNYEVVVSNIKTVDMDELIEQTIDRVMD